MKAVRARLGFPSFDRSEPLRFLFDLELVVDLVSSLSCRLGDSSALFSFSMHFSDSVRREFESSCLNERRVTDVLCFRLTQTS